MLQIRKVDTYPIYNLGSGESITVYGMAERIAARSGEILGYVPEISIDMENIGESMMIWSIVLIRSRTPVFCRKEIQMWK